MVLLVHYFTSFFHTIQSFESSHKYFLTAWHNEGVLRMAYVTDCNVSWLVFFQAKYLASHSKFLNWTSDLLRMHKFIFIFTQHITKWVLFEQTPRLSWCMACFFQQLDNGCVDFILRPSIPCHAYNFFIKVNHSFGKLQQYLHHRGMATWKLCLVKTFVWLSFVF